MSEDKKDKGSSQDKINALKAELKELKAKEEIKKLNALKAELKELKAQEEIKKLNALKTELTELKAQEEIKKLNNEIDSIKKNIQTEETEIAQTFSKSVEIKKKRYIGLRNSILWIFLCNLFFLIVTSIMGHFYLIKTFNFAEIIPEYGIFHKLVGALGFGLAGTIHPLGNMLLVSIIFRKNNLWRTLLLLFLTAFWSVILIRRYLLIT